MMGWILAGMLAASVCAALWTGNVQQLSEAAMNGAQSAVTLGLSIGGALCLWSGVGEAMRRNGMANGIARLCAPLLRRIFPQGWRDRETAGYLSANVAANLLGLGNAATPMGIAAVRRLQRGAKDGAATAESCRLIVLNTASLQLLPTTLAAVRAGLGAKAPLDLLPAVWLSAACSILVGMAAVLVAEKCRR